MCSPTFGVNKFSKNFFIPIIVFYQTFSVKHIKICVNNKSCLNQIFDIDESIIENIKY